MGNGAVFRKKEGKRLDENRMEENKNETDVYETVGTNSPIEEYGESISRKRKGKSHFAKGMLTGAVCMLLVSCLFMTVITSRLKEKYGNRRISDSGEIQAGIEFTGSLMDQDILNKIENIKNTIDYYSLYELDEKDAAEGLYSGLLKSIGDPYSEYYMKEEYEELQQSRSGTFYGIGVGVIQNAEDGTVVITQVYDNSPALEAGIQEEDIIYKVNDKEVTGMELTEVVAAIKGAEGTTVSVEIYRPSEQKFIQMDVERRNIEQIIVYSEMLENNIGYLYLKEFDEVSYDQFMEALNDLESQGMEALILDLRSNPGGLLTSLLPIADELLPEGKILTVNNKTGVVNEYTSDDEKQFNKPMAVLVNGFTASAAEALTGAIQDHQKGTIIGTTTYGKGIVQNIFDLKDGSAIKLTIADYETPNGRKIHGEGIKPDIMVELTGDGEDYQKNKAIEVLREALNQAEAE